MSLLRFEPRPDVTLAPLTAEHAEAMFRWVSNPEIAQNIGLRSSPTLDKTHEWIARALADINVHAYAVLLQKQHVGNVILDRTDTVLLSSRLSIYLGEAFARGQGVGSSAVYRAAKIMFGENASNKIWLTVHTQNVSAIESYKRVGFQIEGTLREEFRLDGKLVDAYYMGLLRSDFEKAGA